MSNPRSLVRGLAVAGALALSASVAVAAGVGPAPHQLWVSHALAGLVAALLGFVASRWWALSGIVMVAALAYALVQALGTTVSPEAIAQFGARYPFHVKATALLLPLMVAAGIGVRLNRPAR